MWMNAWDGWMMLTFTSSFTHHPSNAGSLIPCSATRGKVWGGVWAHIEVLHVWSEKTGVDDDEKFGQHTRPYA